MKGFWETWLHIGVGLACAAVIGGVVYAIYDTGRVAGRDEVWWTRYDKGWQRGYDAAEQRRHAHEWLNKAHKN